MHTGHQYDQTFGRYVRSHSECEATHAGCSRLLRSLCGSLASAGLCACAHGARDRGGRPRDAAALPLPGRRRPDALQLELHLRPQLPNVHSGRNPVSDRHLSKHPLPTHNRIQCKTHQFTYHPLILTALKYYVMPFTLTTHNY